MAEGDQAGPSGRDTLRIFTLLVVAFGSAAAGFLLVTRLFGPAPGEGGADAAPPPAPIDGGIADAGGLLPPAVPVERPDVTLGEPFYFRCWETAEEVDGGLRRRSECGRLPPLERLIASRLGEARGCRDRSTRPVAEGTVSLAVDAHFGEKRLRIWSGRSSTLENAAEVATCLRRELEDYDISPWLHRYERYTVFFTLVYGGEASAGDAGAPDAGTAVRVVLDRVRLRESPEHGRILARLRRGETVFVLERGDGWFRVRTADGREGWIYEPAITGESE